MLLPKFIRKILAIFRGGVSPVLITLSVGLGLWFGLIPGWSGFHTAILIAFLLLNIHAGLFLLSAAIGKTLCFGAAPVLFYIGVGVHNYLFVLLHLLSSIPVLGMTDFSRYSVAGAIVIGPIIGFVCGLLLARFVVGFRRKMVKLEERSEQFKKWYSKRWVYFLDRLLIGKRTKDAKALFTKKSKIIRKAGVVVAVFVLAVAAATTTLIKNDMIKDYAARTMTRANGAEVNMDSVDVSVLRAAVSVLGIQVTDAKKPQNNQVSIGKIAADASLYNLLLGKLVMDDVEFSNVKFNEKRAVPGKVVEDTKWEPPVFEPRDFKLESSDIEKLERYFKNAKAAKEWLQKVRKWLPKPGIKPRGLLEEVPQKYLHYLRARAPTKPSPRILAKKILLDKVQIPSQLFGNSRVSFRNLSDSAETAGLPVTLEIKSYDTQASLRAIVDYASQEQTPPVSGTFDSFDLEKITSNLSRNSGLILESGTASGKFDGKVTNELIDLTINVVVRDIKAKSQGNGIWGLDSKTASEAIEVLKNLNATIRVVGPVSQPRLAFDVKGLREELKEALVKARKDRLAHEIDKQIEKKLDKKLGDKLPGELKDALKKSGGFLDGLGGIRKKKDDKKQE